jgi:6-phosphofructokinase 1
MISDRNESQRDILHNKLGILVGGGPAPGINSVIGAAAIRAILRGYEVIGIHEGFRWIMRGDVAHIVPLSIDPVSRIHFRGGSRLGLSRDNPTKDPEHLKNTLDSLQRLGIDKLITIGGDDTAYSALKLQEIAGDSIRVVHVPKTIDNDLDLPHGMNTFGYQTARHVGCSIVKNLMLDARTTSRWYIVVSMGRKAGHLALGIGKAAGATVTVIPEAFKEPKIRLIHVADILAGTIIKRLSSGRPDGIAILAEGLMERLHPEDLERLGNIEHDEHGHIRLGEIIFGPVIKKAANTRLAQFGIRTTITTKDIGYELRCADPIPFDMEYTRDLGFCAAQFIIDGGSAAIVSIVNGHFKPLDFRGIIDPKTQRPRVRMVDIKSEYYQIATRYMLNLKAADFENKTVLAQHARTCGITPEQFRDEFAYSIKEGGSLRASGL